MNKKLLFFAFALVFCIAGVFAQASYYVGDSSFELPQISVQGDYPSDATHKTYFACLSGLDGELNAVSMQATDKCELDTIIFNPTSDKVGEHTYVTSINYVVREWTPGNGWQTIDEGIDNSNLYDFEVVYEIPEDDFSTQSWMNGLLGNIQDFFCSNFGIFCGSNGDDNQHHPVSP